MGLFDKKYCDICGEKIGLLGNRKLEDGNLCKDCAKKLSPWFDDRRHSTVEEIREQLAYRERNREVLRSFSPTMDIGENGHHLFIDEPKGQFVAAHKLDRNDNPDVINLSQVISCYMDAEERKNEIYRTDSEGNHVSYEPPRYEYSYDYKVYINVDSPYFNELKLPITTFSVKAEDHNRRHNVERIGYQMVNYLSQFASQGSMGGPQGGMMNRQGMDPNMGGMQGGAYGGMNSQGMPPGMGGSQGGMMNRQGMDPNMGGMQGGAYGGMNSQGMNPGMGGPQGGMMNRQGMDPNMRGMQGGTYGGMNSQGMGDPQGSMMNCQGMDPDMGGSQSGGQWTCPSCGAVNSSRFCESCGTPRQ